MSGHDEIAAVCVWMGSRTLGEAAAIGGPAPTPSLCAVFWGALCRLAAREGPVLSPCPWLTGSSEYVALGSRVPRAVVEGAWYGGQEV